MSQTDKKEQELKILHDVAKDISDDLDLNQLLKRIVDTLVRFVKVDSCLIYLYNKANNELVFAVSNDPEITNPAGLKLKMGEGITGWAAKEKKPVALSKEAYKDKRFKEFAFLKEDKYEALLSVPILSRNEIVGVINLQHKKEHVYPENQVKVLFTVGRYLGSAIRNAMAHEEILKKAGQLDLLSQISQTIVSDYYLKEILHLIVAMTAKVMGSKICSIMLLDQRKDELVISATQSLSDDYINKPNLKIGQSISGKVVVEKKPITVLNVTGEPGYMYPKIAKKEGIVSLLSVPMMIKDKVIGVINSYTKNEHNFRKEEIEILQAVANQAAVAIENTNLSREILAAKEALESRKIVERAKGILMKELSLTEDEAYKKIHKKSMDMRKTMKEIAEAVILASEMRKKA